MLFQRGTRGRPKLKVLKYVESTSIIQWASMAKIEAADPQGTAWYSQVFNCSPSKRCKTSSVPVSSITNIFDKESKDFKTDSIRRQILNLSSNCCLLVTKERTLDLTFKNNKMMSLITSALKDLMKS